MAVWVITPMLKARFHQYLEFLGLKLGQVANFHASSLEIADNRVVSEIR